jgi:hypothetical protein
MEKSWILLIVTVLFFIITFFYWILTSGFIEKVYGKKIWKHWGVKTFYWTGALFVSGGITVMLIFILKWFNILAF